MPGTRSTGVFAVALLWTIAVPGIAPAQFGGGFGRGAVGGISIDAKGIVNSIDPKASEELSAERRQILSKANVAKGDKAPLRKVSLARLCERIKTAEAAEKAAPDDASLDILFLGGLERITHVFVDPDAHDIVLAGPADRAIIDATGNVVAAGSGRPLLRLEDLVIALTAIEKARGGGIRCSIDPTPDGINRLQAFLKSQRTIGDDPNATLRAMEDALGMQVVSVGGVPNDSRFAQVLVAADYRLKRIGMGLEPSGLRELPSYLSMVPAGGPAAATPRFWLEPSYEPIVRDPDELAWKIGDCTMQCLTESDLFDGEKMQRGKGKGDQPASKWCELFTTNYPKLAAKQPVFQELVNCADMAVVAALIHGRQLDARAGIDLSLLKDPAKLGLATYAVPKNVASVASGVRKSGRWVVSASGGVLFQPWAFAANTSESPDAGTSRELALAARPANGWWWD